VTHRRNGAPIVRNRDTIEKAGGGCILSFGQEVGNKSIKVAVVEPLLSRYRRKKKRRKAEDLRNTTLLRRECALQGEKIEPKL
jgi:hypothetical protein